MGNGKISGAIAGKLFPVCSGFSSLALISKTAVSFIAVSFLCLGVFDNALFYRILARRTGYLGQYDGLSIVKPDFYSGFSYNLLAKDKKC